MSTQSQPHPRTALRNRNLPKLPDFEFPVRAPSPRPLSASRPQRAEPPSLPPPRTPNQQSSSPILTPQVTTTQTEAQLNSEIKAEKDRQLFRAKGASRQAEGTAGSQRVVEGSEGKDKRQDRKMAISDMNKKGQWIFYAITSGACAAVNGVFAKLTTTEVTTNFATFLANLIGLEKGEKVFEFLVRAIFFLLNLLFNAIMWALFTKALSRGPGTTQVSILNTSSNFMLTALMGFIIFSESLPALWWLGAAMLVAGNVIIGRREEKELPVDGEGEGIRAARRSESGENLYRGPREEDRALLSEDFELSETESEELRRKRQVHGEVEEDILDLESLNSSSK